VNAVSPTWMFQGVAERLGLDRTRPRVPTYPGAGTRGRNAVFVARVADDRGEARMQVDLTYRNQLVFRTMTLLKRVRWSVKQHFDSRVALSRSLHPGPFRLVRHGVGPDREPRQKLRALLHPLGAGPFLTLSDRGSPPANASRWPSTSSACISSMQRRKSRSPSH
jgi:hypothetical protein